MGYIIGFIFGLDWVDIGLILGLCWVILLGLYWVYIGFVLGYIIGFILGLYRLIFLVNASSWRGVRTHHATFPDPARSPNNLCPQVPICHNILYCTMIYSSIPEYTILCNTRPYYTIIYYNCRHSGQSGIDREYRLIMLNHKIDSSLLHTAYIIM